VDALLLVSARAGAAEREAVDAAAGVFARAGSVEIAEPSSPAALDRVLADRDGRLPVVAGGDGSLHLVVARLRRRRALADTALGLVPLGTGNDLARHLDLPLEPVPAAERVVDGTERALDLIRDDAGGIAVNAVHLGLGAEAAERSAAWKSRLGRLAYPLGAVAALLRPEGARMRVEVDDQLLADGDRLLMVGIANGSSVGGGAQFFPEAQADDGLLEVGVLGPPGGPFAGGPAGPAGERFRLVRRGRGRAVTVVLLGGATVGSNADGELGTLTGRRSWWVEPAAWRLRC